MQGLKGKITDHRGMTLIELIVALTISLIIIIPIYNFLITGLKLQNKAFSQTELQEKNQETLNRIVEGTGQDAARVGGLRQAGQVTTSTQGAAFIVSDVGSSVYKNVTYYLNDSKIYYKASDVGPGVSPFLDTGGLMTPVLENVTDFRVLEYVYNTKKIYSISITTSRPQPGAPANTVTLTAEVRPRNMK